MVFDDAARPLWLNIFYYVGGLLIALTREKAEAFCQELEVNFNIRYSATTSSFSSIILVACERKQSFILPFIHTKLP